MMLPYTTARNSFAAIAVERLLKLAAHKSDAALDLGCGNGQKTFPLGYLFTRVIGVDSSRPMLEDVERNKLKDGKDGNITFLEGDFAKIPVDDESQDCVTMWISLHFADPETLIPELRRVL